MAKLNYLNVGCGNKTHPDWVNIDMASNSPDVIVANILKGMPFPDNTFDVVYHSQVLEHFPKERAHAFIKECCRVLKPNGVIRVVVPDLENIVDEYKNYLNKCLESPTEMNQANYDWMMLEIYDQTVRNHTGGNMVEFLRQPKMVNEDFVIGRTGFVGNDIRSSYLSGGGGRSFSETLKRAFSSMFMFKKAVNFGVSKLRQKLNPFRSTNSKVGAFRMGGEVHLWMYDRFSLARLLKECGFENVSIVSPTESRIPNWSDYGLDVKGGFVHDPTSLFAEAVKK
ncbi:MAG: methyltransferase domain-containing protein [Flavobacteriales bacterium]|nr:methyltransferase domain-containing protein [Flavobacteriales bacterium]